MFCTPLKSDVFKYVLFSCFIFKYTHGCTVKAALNWLTCLPLEERKVFDGTPELQLDCMVEESSGSMSMKPDDLQSLTELSQPDDFPAQNGPSKMSSTLPVEPNDIKLDPAAGDTSVTIGMRNTNTEMKCFLLLNNLVNYLFFVNVTKVSHPFGKGKWQLTGLSAAPDQFFSMTIFKMISLTIRPAIFTQRKSRLNCSCWSTCALISRRLLSFAALLQIETLSSWFWVNRIWGRIWCNPAHCGHLLGFYRVDAVGCVCFVSRAGL